MKPNTVHLHRSGLKASLSLIAVATLSACGGGPSAPAARETVAAVVRGELTLHQAAREGNVDALSYFIDDGAELDGFDEYGEAPLHYAAHYGQTDALGLLLFAGATPHTVDASGKTPLQIAEENGFADIAQALRAAGAME